MRRYDPRASARVILTILLVLGILPAMACNLSLGDQTPTPEPAEALRQTLQALSLPSPTPGPVLIATETSPAPTEPEVVNTELPPPAEVLPTIPAAPAGLFPTLTPLPLEEPALGDSYAYTVRWGDTVEGVALRFMVEPAVIRTQTGDIPGYLNPGSALVIPRRLAYTTLPYPLLPDSELVYSPSALGFDLEQFIQQAGGFLSTYSEEVGGELLSGAQAIQRVADELSVNPRLLLAMLEFRSGWVYGQPPSVSALIYPIGFYVPDRKGLYEEIKITATQLNKGYYGWRQGTELHVIYPDERALRISPDLNAGTASLQRLFGMFFTKTEDWENALYGRQSFPVLYQKMYGDPWKRAAAVEPLLPPNLAQPSLELPFLAGVRWKYTGGPHDAWNAGTPRGALDFAPPNGTDPICLVSADWASASAAGVIARSAQAAVALDLDGDGFEQTGWVLVYMHLAYSDRISEGEKVALDDLLGHPSCEGGVATARHLHIARKYNGEWLPAVGPVPFVLGGWAAQPSENNYRGALEKDGRLLYPSLYGESTSYITR